MKRKILILAFLMLAVILTGCGGKNGVKNKTTIIDYVTLTETTKDEVIAKWDEKNLVYKDAYRLVNKIADEFLGYDSYYELGKNDDNTIEWIRIFIGFHNDEEVKQANSDITTYLESRLVEWYEEGIKYKEAGDSTTRYIYPITSYEKENEPYYRCVTLAKCTATSEEEMMEGYSSNYFELEYFDVSEAWFIEAYVNGKISEEADNEDADSEDAEDAASEECDEVEEVTESTDEKTLNTEKINEAVDETAISDSEKEKIFSNFLGYWVWEDEVDIYKLGGRYGGLSVEKFKSGYEISVTRGLSWSDKDLTGYYDKELVFEWDDEMFGHVKVTLTRIDENTIEQLWQTNKGSEIQRAINSSFLGESGNIEESIEQIRTWYYDTQDRLDSMLYDSYGTNLYCYFDGPCPAKVVAKSGYNDWNVTREYYYHDQKLYFVFVYGDSGEYRFYVKDGVCIRSISPDGSTVDHGYGMTQESIDIYNRVISDEETFPHMIDCGA